MAADAKDEGIGRVLGEIRDIKKEILDLRLEGAQDRKRSDEDRKRADARWEKLTLRSDARFERYVEESKQREKVILKVGQRIIRTQDEQTKLLKAILHTLRIGGDGRGGGNSKPRGRR